MDKPIRIKRITTLILMTIAMMLALAAVSYAGNDTGDRDVIAYGKCGTSDWDIDMDGTLTIHPGKMDDWRIGNTVPWNEYTSNIRRVRTEGKVELETAYYMFGSCENLTEINLSDFDTSRVDDMSGMFWSCKSLEKITWGNFNTSSVVSMGEMFWECSSLKELDLSFFDTSCLQNMRDMFFRCISLECVDLTGWDTSKVTDMSQLFWENYKLEEVDVSKFNTSNVVNMGGMFAMCEVLKVIDVSGFDTSKALYMNDMFDCCRSVTELDVSGFDTSKVTTMYYMFCGCESLEKLDVSGFDTSNVTDMSAMFTALSKPEVIDVSGFDTSKVTSMSFMFNGCISITELDVSGFDTSKVTSMDYMLSNLWGITELDIGNFDLSSVTQVDGMFTGSYSIARLVTGNMSKAKVIPTMPVRMRDTETGIVYAQEDKMPAVDKHEFIHVHTYVVDQDSLIEPTCTDTGYRHKTCGDCKEEVSETVEPLGHILVLHEAKPATEAAPGNKEYYSCDRCGRFFADSNGTNEIEKYSWVIAPDTSASSGDSGEQGEKPQDGAREEEEGQETGVAQEDAGKTPEIYDGDSSGISITTARELTSVSLEKSVFQFTKKAVKPEIVVKAGNITLSKSDYTVEFRKNRGVGKATVIVRGKGIYSGTIEKEFRIVPDKARIKAKSYRAIEGTQIIVSVSSKSKPKYYELILCKDKKCKKVIARAKFKRKSLKGGNIYAYKRLKRGKTFYIRVRGLNSKKVAGTFSKAAKIKGRG